MVRRFPWWVAACCLLAVPLFVVGVGVSRHGGTQGPLLLGADRLDSLISSAGSGPVLINFWATWCSPCVHELPVLDSLFIEMGGSAAFVAVSIGDPSLETLQSFREGTAISMPVVWLSPDEASLVRERYGIPPVLPVTIIIRDGVEISRIIGAATGERFALALQGAALPVEAPVDGSGVHIFVVGRASDPLTKSLLETAQDVAGAENVELADPETPGGQDLITGNFLPVMDRPYAQACVGSACRPPVYTPEQLMESIRID